MKKILLLLLGFTLSSYAFSQSYSEWLGQGSRISVKFNGSNMTVKWTNSSNGVTTKNAICQPFRTTVQMEGRNGYNYVEKERKCKCNDNSGNYFIFRLADITYSIDYYNELDDKIWDRALSKD
jgi:hypothetical protein